MSTPFAASKSIPGHGKIDLRLLSPSTSVLQELSYQYPLKLIAPAPIDVNDKDEKTQTVHTVFLLTYGGGLVAGDTIDLNVILDTGTRLVFLTQGSTKIFKTPSPSTVSHQRTHITISPNAALVYLPEPVQPFAHSAFEQLQVYDLASSESNLCVCDWVSEGRTARGEKWNFFRYASKNEVWLAPNGEGGKRRLLLRDNVMLLSSATAGNTNSGLIANKVDNLGVFGTLIIRGPLFAQLGRFFTSEFAALPRIGVRKWDGGSDNESEPTAAEMRRTVRQRQEQVDGLLWTAASVRGSVLVKFGAREVEGAKRWLRSMLRDEGTVQRHFGERALLCLK